MPRAKGGVRGARRRKRVLKLAKGMYSAKSRLFVVAKESVDRALANAYRGRKERKGDFRRLWITRINIAARDNGTTYKKLIHLLTTKNVKIDRKILADLAVKKPDDFKKLIAKLAA